MFSIHVYLCWLKPHIRTHYRRLDGFLHVPCASRNTFTRAMPHTETNICASCRTQNLSIFLSCVRLGCFNSSPKREKLKKRRWWKGERMRRHIETEREAEWERKKKKNFKLYVLFTNEILLYQMATRLSLRCNKVSRCRWASHEFRAPKHRAPLLFHVLKFIHGQRIWEQQKNFKTETARTCSCNYLFTTKWNETRKNEIFFSQQNKKEVQKRNVKLIFTSNDITSFIVYLIVIIQSTIKHTRRKMSTPNNWANKHEWTWEQLMVRGWPLSWWAVH